MRRKKEVTMQDIADFLSISKVTVSKAFHGKDGVSEELRKKIIEVGKAMNYKVPDSVREAGRSGNIAIFMKEKFADGEAGFYLKFYQKISMELTRQGYFANLFPVSDKYEMEGKLGSLLEQYDIAGIILLGELSKGFLDEVEDSHIPCIMVDTYDRERKLDCVITESVYSMCRLTRHLMDCGHKEIGFVGTVSATNSITDRFLGYVKAHAERGLSIRDEWVLKDRNPDSEDVEFTLPNVMPTAFVCNCDDTAYQFIRMLREQGYQVPQDISIVSFDNDIYAELCVPRLTTAAVNIELMAEEAVKLIRCKMDKEEESFGVVFINASILYRDSVKIIS